MKKKQSIPAGQSVRWKRQINSSLFERLLLSRGDANKEQVLALAEKGVDYTKPEDIIKDPYVFEFWDCRKKSLSSKATWKLRWCGRSRTSCWNWGADSCLSAHSSVSR